MTDSDNDLVEIPEFREITQEEGARDKNLLADPSKADEGILDDEDPERFVELEAEAAEDVILAEDVGRRWSPRDYPSSTARADTSAQSEGDA